MDLNVLDYVIIVSLTFIGALIMYQELRAWLLKIVSSKIVSIRKK